MDARNEDSIRAEICAIEAIPIAEKTEHHFRRLNDLEAEIRRRHPELQGMSQSFVFICVLILIRMMYDDDNLPMMYDIFNCDLVSD